MPTRPVRTRHPVAMLWVLLAALLAACSGRLGAESYGAILRGQPLAIAAGAVEGHLAGHLATVPVRPRAAP